ncbi:MAG: hypothetical protein JW852_07950, partial [Spirochaetales bacterium]|nr:hypothetical protein [Spirochaetales bacterium]
MSLTLGIDSGSVAVGYVFIDDNARIVHAGYRVHNGDPSGCARRLVAESGITEPVYAATVASSPAFMEGAVRFDDTVCWVTAAKRLHPGLRSLLVIGGERFALIGFDGSGGYRRMKTNTSCAAGTGSFIDQQARRLNLSGGAELSDLAERSKGEAPSIASRCSVFAKTDIIHAQQEGYRIEEICDGICFGLARNAADVLFDGGKVDCPAVFSGGVARNAAVKRHLGSYLGMDFLTDDYAHLYGALGAAYCLQAASGGAVAVTPATIIQPVGERKRYYFPPLQLAASTFPDFDDHQRRIYTPHLTQRELPAFDNPVEVDCYSDLSDRETTQAVIGIDIGSTSTKAAVCSLKGEVKAGFYTRTAGRPIEAVMGLFEAIDSWIGNGGAKLTIAGVATTGSGRKLSGAVIGADLVMDEITAHARAALDLYPEVDTIIEIGGQDSKFTALKDGRVTFSKMNTVCAAGTGSFLEEQAARLDVPIDRYAEKAMGSRAPLTSDRCTVFMERDINSFLHKNYSTEEILAAAAHSVCENYLLKVASEGHIGSHIVFQGATAKNRALVAALEQKLGKKIHVSRYCHLTGAVGAALSLLDEGDRRTAFRGIDLFRKKIPVTRENCGLCRNHCRLTIAEIDGEKIAYGFLCGRDYDTKRFVSKNKSGFDLLAERERIEKASYPVRPESGATARGKRVGIPSGLHLSEDVPFWRTFFRELGFSVVDSSGFEEAVKRGKLIAGAEFCAPMAAFHGHASYLREKADILFIPTYIENIHSELVDNAPLRKLCYYALFAPVLVRNLEENPAANSSVRCAAPVFDPRLGKTHMLKALREALRDASGETIETAEVQRAYEIAEAAREKA